MSEWPSPLQIRRWQEEVARDPGATAFLPLAEVYRREGRIEVAKRICRRGLERHPMHVEAHALLGRIHQESGELDQAFDEWDITLSLDPDHRPSRRAIGLLCFERQDWAGVERHLGLLDALGPVDDPVRSALEAARRYLAQSGGPGSNGAVPRGLAESLAPLLESFVRESRVRFVLVIDASGRVVAQQGVSRDLDVAGFASLGAAVDSASRALAQLLGQRRFEQLYQGRGEHQIFFGRLPSSPADLILLAVFGSDATLGLVRVLFDALSAEVGALPPIATQPRFTQANFERELAAGVERLFEFQ